MQIKREGEPTFIPVVITLENDLELEVLKDAVEGAYDSAPANSKEETTLKSFREFLYSI